MRFRPEGGVTAMLAAVLLAPQCSITSPSELVQVRVAVDDSVLSATDTIDVVVTVTNHGRDAVVIDPSGCPQVFRVLDREGDVVGPESVSCLMMVVGPKALAPGETFELEYRWSGRGTSGHRLPPGLYHLQGWVDAIQEERLYGDLVRVRIEAP